MRVLVTGANGYIGRHVVDKLLDKGAEVVAVDFDVSGINQKAECKALDIFSENVNTFAETNNPDAVLHLAWKDGFAHNSQAHMENLSRHFLFCKHMIDSGVKRLAVMGSMHEVGYHEGAIDEHTPCNPISMYGIAKDALRRAVLLYGKDKETVIQWLRGYYIYGDDKKSPSIFGKICSAALEGKKTFPFTSGKNKYDFISVDELSRQIAACVTYDKAEGIINCCTGKPVSLAEKVEGFIRENGFPIKLEYNVFPDRPYDSPGVWGDVSKINSITNPKESTHAYP